MKKIILSIVVYACLLISVTIFSSERLLEYEIVPFDYADEGMREQICHMIAQDREIQNMMHETEESMREMLSNLGNKKCIVYRSTDDKKTVCGFIIYFFSDIAYFTDPERRGILFDLHYKNEYKFLETVPDLVHFGFIDDIAVHKNYRGQGIAQALLKYFEQDCKNHGLSMLLLGVEKENYKARQSYNKFGFKVHPVYSEQIMMKKLD